MTSKKKPIRLKNQRPLGIDLFAGAGGLSLGFEQAGFDIVAAVDIDPIHCAVHEFNFPYCEAICKDITKLKAGELRLRTGLGDREIDIVFGGAPCQGFSMIGKRLLEDPRNKLVKHFVRLVLDLRPKFFVFENVPGLALGKHKQILNEMIQEFLESGYRVVEPFKILHAAEYGIPQDRKRLFLMGFRSGMSAPIYPLPICRNRNNKTKNSEGSSRLPLGPSVWDAIGDLPSIEKFDELYKKDWVLARYEKGSDYSRILRVTKKEKDNFSYRRNFERNFLTSSTRTKHAALSQKRFSETNCGETESVSRFYKLDPNGLCNTIRAGTASDRGAFTSPRPIHPFVPRCITVREAARLHSYPDWFRFHVTKWHGFRQIGNSVPPLLARAIGKTIVVALNIKPSIPEPVLEMGNEMLLFLNMKEAARHYNVPSDTIKPRTRKLKIIKEKSEFVFG